MSIYENIKKAVQDVIAPDIQEIKGELKAVNIRLDGIRQEINGDLKAVNVRLDGINQRFDDLVERLDLKRRVEILERERQPAKQ